MQIFSVRRCNGFVTTCTGRTFQPPAMPRNISYSEKYEDEIYEYRHVILPSEVAKMAPKNRLMSEQEWRQLGVQQSRGWEHYAIHKPEPHILLFRRVRGTDPLTGLAPAKVASKPAVIQQQAVTAR